MRRNAWVVVLVATMGCHHGGEVKRPTAATWDQTVSDLIAGFVTRAPVWAAGLGKHEYDGQLPDWSEAKRASDQAWEQSERDAIGGMDTATMSAEQKFQREYVLAELDGDLFWDSMDGFHKNPGYYVGDLFPSMYLTRDYAPLATRMAAFVKYEQAMPKALVQMRANLRPPFDQPRLTFALNAMEGLDEFLDKEALGVFASVTDAQLQADAKASNAAALVAIRETTKWLHAQEATATPDGYQLGAENFAKMLWASQRVNTPLDELKRIGQANLERDRKALGEACEQFAPGKPIPDCMTAMNALKPEGGVIAAAQAELAGLRKFVEDNHLVTIPGTEQAVVHESPSYDRQNSASIDIPGAFEKPLPSIFYISPPDPKWSAEDQAAYIPGRAVGTSTSIHEVFPGHFVQYLHLKQSKWEFARIFTTYSFSEGWAHYTEEMMFDAGVGGATPEFHVGQLSDALLRDVRFVSALGLHTGTMTLAQSEAMFHDVAFQDPGNSRQQALRGAYDPGYLNYTLGKLMIMALRDEWCASRGGRAAWGAFHDQFLSYGSPPIPLVRQQMLGGDIKAVLWESPAH